tara:strand:+ start:208 stop:459 length:252 start_codon:yes stop_codon:yes gene_type:complete
MRVYKNKDSLLRALARKQEIVKRLHEDSVRKFSNLGWGYANRGYSRALKSNDYVLDKHRKDFEELEHQLVSFNILKDGSNGYI